MADAARWSFAVLADTHIESGRGASANKRAEAIVAALARHSPDFVLHLGDVIHPLPGSSEAASAAGNAREILARLACPLHVVPGNHDIGDKALPGRPARLTSDSALAQWEAYFGRQSEYFDHADCRFVLINSPVLDGGAQAADRLKRQLAASVEDRQGRRIFIATHYPLFLFEDGEPSHYDNVGEAGRAIILDFCRKHRVEAVFSGHVHHFLYRESENVRLVGAPSSTFLRRDFSEMFKSADLVEFGREDPRKLGFLWVDVLPGELRFRMVSLNDLDDFARHALAPGLPREAGGNIGVNLRHNWAETVELPFNPPTSTFSRKKLRDDYTYRVLTELGIRLVRFPLTDLADEQRRLRARELRNAGIGICAFLPTPCDRATRKLLDKNAQELDILELACGDATLDSALEIAGAVDCSVVFGMVEDPEASSGRPRHHVGYGFESVAAAQAFAPRLSPRAGQSGVVFSFDMSQFAAADLDAIGGFCAESGIGAIVLLNRLAADTIAVADDRTLALDTLRIMRASARRPEIALILDSFMRFDRGYHAREGLVDRLLNPTEAGMALRNSNRVRIGRTDD